MKILISGYYGFGNVGDEAVLESIISGFRRHSPEIKLVVLSAAPELTAELSGVPAIHRYDLPGVLWEMIKTDVFVSGGGTLFQDATSSRSFWYYLGMVFLAKLLRKKVVIFAQGFGPLRKIFNRWLARFILDRVDLITLRDEDSSRQMKALGVKRPAVLVTADPTALLEIPSKSEGRRILALEGVPLDKPLLGVAVRGLLRPGSESKLFGILAEKLDELCAKRGLQPVFLLFQCPEDMRAASLVMDRMKEKSYAVFRICRPKEMLALFSQFELVVGMRLHSLIFAAMNHVPMLGISYDPKVEAFMNSIGQPCFKAEQFEKMGDVLEEIFSRRSQIARELEGHSKILLEKADLNFELFQKEVKA